MAKESYKDLSLDYVKKVIDYNPETGLFYHKYRSRDMFKSERSYKTFNSRFAGKEAGCIQNLHRGRPTAYWVKNLRIDSKHVLASRLAWFIYYGKWPES
jgi:hypothetical protein